MSFSFHETVWFFHKPSCLSKLLFGFSQLYHYADQHCESDAVYLDFKKLLTLFLAKILQTVEDWNYWFSN